VGRLYTAIHLLAYFASSLPNINTLKLYFFLPLPLFCRVDVVKFGADACLCVPMRADAVDTVISHTVFSQFVFLTCQH